MARIQILGIGCKKSRALKMNLLEALERTGVEAEVEEVTEIGRIMQFQATATPALLINGELFYQGVVPEVAELEHLLRNYRRQFQGARRVVLATTDFSEASANALRFARAIAGQRDATVRLLHVFHQSYEEDNPLREKSTEDILREKQERLTSFIQAQTPVAAERSGAPVKVEPCLRHGFPVEEIVDMSLQSELVVMGIRSERAPLERIFGSIATAVSEQALCPVLLVPSRAVWRGFQTIIVATEAETGDEAAVRRLSNLLGERPAKVHFVRVETAMGAAYSVEERGPVIPSAEGTAGAGYQAVRLLCEELLSGLSRYAEDQSAELIVMGARHRHFLKRLLHGSLTRRMILRAPRPLLFIPD